MGFDYRESSSYLLGKATALLKQIAREGAASYPAQIDETTMKFVLEWISEREAHHAAVAYEVELTREALGIPRSHAISVVKGEVSA